MITFKERAEALGGYDQGSFWVWVLPMRDDITMQCHLSLAEPIPREIPDDPINNASTFVFDELVMT